MQPPVLIPKKARLWPSISSEMVTLPTAPTLPARPSPLTLFTAILGLLGGIVFGSLYAFTGSGSGILILAFMGMSVLAGIGSLVTYIIQTREVRRNTDTLLNIYEKALEEKEKYLHILQQKEAEARLSIDPPLPRRGAIDEHDTHLWNRRPDDPDFLAVRLGMGDCPATFTLRSEERNSIVLPTPSERFNLLNQRMQSMKTAYASVSAPITVGLGKHGSIAVAGSADMQGVEQARSVTRMLLAHLMYHHSPEDVRIVILAPASQQKRWTWATNLPHTLGYAPFPDAENADGIHMVALGPGAIMAQLSLLSRELSRRELLLGDERHSTTTAPVPLPRLVVVVDSFDSNNDLEQQRPMGVMDFSQTSETSENRVLLTVSPLQRPELTMALSHGKRVGVTVVSICMGKASLPATCELVIDVERRDEKAETGTENAASGPSTKPSRSRATWYFAQPDPPPPVVCETLDYCSLEDLVRFAAFMRPLRPVITKRPQLRTQVDLRAVFELPLDPITYNPAEWWRASGHSASALHLRIPLGQKIGDELQYLDLLNDGPHGLLIGQTGSGKSELLQTIIMAFALLYSPQQINFLLIDYKAGLALEPFAQLPHTIGFLTNISSASQIQRFITMLRAEAVRRQKREKERKPMPRLLIIIDEFAQMIKQTESVLDEIFTITRVGREIGMHLLLAAQRPEGVIASKVRDYVQYRLCLRVASPEDSREMLGRIDAAQLPVSIPGRGYLLHGDNQLDLFQAARATLPVEGGTTTTLRAMSGQKKTLADVLIERCVAFYPREQAQKDGILYWPEPLPIPGTLTPDPLVLFTTRQERSEQRAGVDELAPHPLLAVTPPAMLSLRDKQPLLKELLVQGQEITEMALSFPLGLADMPAEQKSIPFCIDLQGVAGKVSGGPLLVAGIAGSGKATALQTMLFWFVTRYTARSLRCILIDPDHDLDAFHDLPHMYDDDGTSLYSSGESDDELLQLMNHVASLLATRRQNYHQQRWDEQTMLQLQLRGNLPTLLLVVSNYQSFAERYLVNGPLKDLVMKFAEARSLGASVVLTTADVSGRSFPYELIPRMGTRIGLFLNDDQQRYTLFGRQTASIAHVPGRGLAMLRDSSLYEVQLALPLPGGTEKERYEQMKRVLENFR